MASSLQARYHEACSVLCAALEQHCAGLAAWSVPRGGMFIWMRILCCEDANDLLGKLIEDKVRWGHCLPAWASSVFIVQASSHMH